MRQVCAFLALPCLLAAQDGLAPMIGGLPPDSGLALGVVYRKAGLGGGPVDFRAKAIGSTKKYEHLEAALGTPRLAGGLLFAEISARYRNYPEEDFWGLGPKSSRADRTTFRLEDFDSTATFGVRPLPRVEIGVAGGLLLANTGKGKDKDWPSIEQRFAASDVPALDRQPNFWHTGAFVRVDYRNATLDPRHGGLYEFRWTRFQDRDFGRFDFRRYQVDLRQFVPVFEDRDTIAARFFTTLTDSGAGGEVPFFFQPTVGGGSDLRGYHQYRFRDRNALVINLEYRWRAREILHVVVFGDGGRVFRRPGDFALSGLRGSTGIGGRLKLGESFLFGLDVAWSPDGFRVWFRGSQPF